MKQPKTPPRSDNTLARGMIVDREEVQSIIRALTKNAEYCTRSGQHGAAEVLGDSASALNALVTGRGRKR